MAQEFSALFKKMTKVKRLIGRTYLAVIENSVGSNLFRNFYARVNGQEQDIMRDGQLSCAFFVSSVLAIFDLIERVHGTVAGTVRDLKNSGWQKIKKPKPGAVLVWEKSDFGGDGEYHKHLGFYIGAGQAVSNSYQTGQPEKHHWRFGKKNGRPKRQIEAIYWHKKLSSL